ncbi:hypothetical protein VTO58DRAFT_101673 [Aureobasidium pullulans]|nr:hypothetical protein JADG_005029 [Aureobasidium pullulans]KAG2165293.1 hypothetical protein JADG_005032 [Aureobasidium pullulans]KAG2165296.1 hypothetical protein JADG_005035 [Aureobasidium pullulans]
MPVVHIVLFKFKHDTEPSVVKDMCDRMIGLKNTCIHPETQKPYMKSYGGGKNNSPEGAAGGLQYGFVSEFESEADRDYYLNKDPSHLKFVEDVGKIVDKATVFDYEPGVLS